MDIVMKLRHVLAGVGLATAASAAAAQSGVTLAGIADIGLRQVRNEGLPSVKSMVSGSNATSRLIVRGTEDLGDGLYAGFHLEHGIALDTGTQTTANQFWDRRSTLSLGSKAWGELRAGRDFVPTYVNWSRYDPFSYVGVAGANNFVSAAPAGPIRSAFGTSPNTTVRSSNALQWLAPSSLGGFEGGLMAAPSEGGVAANGQHKVVGLRLGYATNAFSLSAAAARTENDLTGADRFDDRVVAGSYDFGVVRVSLGLRRFSHLDARQSNLLLGAWIPAGSGEVKLSLNRADLSGRVGAAAIDANGGRQIGIGYVHNLSKRSALYATLARIDNDGGAAFVVPGGSAGLAGGASSTGYEFGVRHTF